MKKLYIIISSWDEYDSHYKVNECVCSSLFFAENKKTELENKYRDEVPFPFDWCTYKEFLDLFEERKVTEEDAQILISWEEEVERLQAFNCCYINEIDYYENI